MQVWQAILTKKVELDSRKLKSTISDSARDLLKASLHPLSSKTLMRHFWPGDAGWGIASDICCGRLGCAMHDYLYLYFYGAIPA